MMNISMNKSSAMYLKTYSLVLVILNIFREILSYYYLILLVNTWARNVDSRFLWEVFPRAK